MPSKAFPVLLSVLLFAGCEPSKPPHPKSDFQFKELTLPTADVTGIWQGSWQDTAKSFDENMTLELNQIGNEIKGIAIDGKKQRAPVKGQISGDEVLLLLSPPNWPEYTLKGRVKGTQMSGDWYLHNDPTKRGWSVDGPWTADKAQ